VKHHIQQSLAFKEKQYGTKEKQKETICLEDLSTDIEGNHVET
jgi:hypothetical protein